MREIVEADQPFVREEVTRDEALARFADQPFKREIIEALGTAEGEVAAGETGLAVPQRRVGRPVPGAARAVHRPAGRVQADVDSPGPTGAATRPPELTRIYGTAWATRRT